MLRSCAVYKWRPLIVVFFHGSQWLHNCGHAMMFSMACETIKAWLFFFFWQIFHLNIWLHLHRRLPSFVSFPLFRLVISAEWKTSDAMEIIPAQMQNLDCRNCFGLFKARLFFVVSRMTGCFINPFIVDILWRLDM